MALQQGARLGACEILSPLGAGGKGNYGDREVAAV